MPSTEENATNQSNLLVRYVMATRRRSFLDRHLFLFANIAYLATILFVYTREQAPNGLDRTLTWAAAVALFALGASQMRTTFRFVTALTTPVTNLHRKVGLEQSVTILASIVPTITARKPHDYARDLTHAIVTAAQTQATDCRGGHQPLCIHHFPRIATLTHVDLMTPPALQFLLESAR